ncbi:MAG: hypothetical protein ACTS68_01240, partial [Candidatus Hodgkinia cicadicola]
PAIDIKDGKCVRLHKGLMSDCDRYLRNEWKGTHLETHLMFVELEKTCDNLSRVELFETLENSGINPTYVESVYNMNVQVRLKTGREVPESFNIIKGLKQGCRVSKVI